MQRSIVVLVVAGILLVVGYLIWGSTSLVQAECEVCVEFQGQQQCRRGTGTNDQEAQQAAQKAACGVMAFGMDQSIACANARPKVVRCPAPPAP
jgi:O-glycosyl hydrolase